MAHTHLRCAYPVSRYVENIVHPSSYPVEPIGIPAAAISCEVITLPGQHQGRQHFLFSASYYIVIITRHVLSLGVARLVGLQVHVQVAVVITPDGTGE